MVQAGGVKLIELQVCSAATGAPSHCNTITTGAVRVAGVQVYLAGASRCQNDKFCSEQFDMFGRTIEYIGAEATFTG